MNCFNIYMPILQFELDIFFMTFNNYLNYLVLCEKIVHALYKLWLSFSFYPNSHPKPNFFNQKPQKVILCPFFSKIWVLDFELQRETREAIFGFHEIRLMVSLRWTTFGPKCEKNPMLFQFSNLKIENFKHCGTLWSLCANPSTVLPMWYLRHSHVHQVVKLEA